MTKSTETRLECSICGEVQKSPKALGRHVHVRHGMTAQEYYDSCIRSSSEEGVCSVCGKATKFLSIQRGYQEFCSSRCANRSSAKRSAVSAACANRSEDDWKRIAKKCRETRKEHYGDEAYGLYGSAAFAQKMLDRYGDAHYNNIEKSLETNRRNHGGVLNTQVPGFSEAAIETTRQRYGSGNNKEKVRETVRAKYGVDYITQVPSVMAKMAETKRRHSMARMQENLAAQSISILGENESTLHMYCNVCERDFSFSRSHVYHRMKTNRFCPHCHPRQFSYSSEMQREIVDFIKSVYSNEVSVEDRMAIPPMELDVYLPNAGVAFEIDGLYWHSEVYKEKEYHIKKTIACANHGIALYHIFENEWVSNQRLVKSKIRHILGLDENRIIARKCRVERIDGANSDVNAFFEANHLQGFVRSACTYLLTYDDAIVAAMSFGRPRFNHKYDWELLRFATIADTSIAGGAGKLLAAFERDHVGESLVTYADARWGTGRLYETLGFERIGLTKPNYWYFCSNDSLEHRLRYRKSRLAKLLEDFDPTLSEEENMLNHGFYRIFDCGNHVFQKICTGKKGA